MRYYNNVKWFINNRCNLNCPFCFVKEIEGESQTLSEQFKVLDKLHSEGVKFIDFFGKEPLFDSTIFDIMNHGKENRYNDLSYSFISNGKNLKKYTKELIASECRNFTISYDFKSGDRVFQFDLNDLLPFKDLGFSIELSVDVHSGNVDKILEEINVPLNYGVNSLYFNPITPFGTSDVESCITEENYDKFINDVYDRISEDYEIIIKIPYTFKGLTKYYHSLPWFVTEPVCTAGKTHFCIDSRGTAFGCVSQCASGNTKNTCDYLSTPKEELYRILSNHTKRLCI